MKPYPVLGFVLFGYLNGCGYCITDENRFLEITFLVNIDTTWPGELSPQYIRNKAD